MSARPLPEDALLAQFWPRVLWISTHGKADEALALVREVQALKGKLHLSIVPSERVEQVTASGFVGRALVSRFPGRCAVCSLHFGADVAILYDPEQRKAAHYKCGLVDE